MGIIDKYQILNTLGSQSKRKFGHVYLVINKATGEKGVLKSLQITPTNLLLQDRIRKEAELTFNCKGLPATLDFYEDENELVLIKSYCPGIPLDEFWKSLSSRERLPTLKILISQLIPLFEELKKESIVHCDLKPSNIIIDKINNQLNVSLIDFGMALRNNQHNKRTTLFPLGYAAPELILNRLDLVDERTDLYALGIIIWRLFEGKLPLTHPNPSIFTNLQLTHPLPEGNELPKGLFPLLQKLSAKHSFKTAPNTLPSDEVDQLLVTGMNMRYDALSAFYTDLEGLKKRNWFGF